MAMTNSILMMRSCQHYRVLDGYMFVLGVAFLAMERRKRYAKHLLRADFNSQVRFLLRLSSSSPLLIGAQLRVLINIVYESPAAFDAIILATDPMAYAQP